VTTIDSTSRFLAQIRSRVAAVARQSSIGRKTADGAAIAGKESPPRDVQGLILRRVLAIGLDDPDRRRKAFRIFLESVLSDELGRELINDPAFHRIVDDVQTTMERDAALRPALEKAGEFLLESAQRGLGEPGRPS
jgi:hypothetical protein